MRSNLSIFQVIPLLFYLLSGACNAHDSGELRPGIVGYATNAFNELSEKEKQYLSMVYKCIYIADNLGKEEKKMKFLTRAYASSVPVWWKNVRTEVHEYYRGYTEAAVTFSPDSTAQVYATLCAPLLEQEFESQFGVTTKEYEKN